MSQYAFRIGIQGSGFLPPSQILLPQACHRKNEDQGGSDSRQDALLSCTQMMASEETSGFLELVDDL